VGGLVAAQLLPVFGWRGILAIGGGLPLVLVPMLALALPESLRWLVLRGRDGSAIAARIAGNGIAPTLQVSDERQATGSPVRQLFVPGLVGGTLLLWVTFFMSLLIIYLLSSWLPTILNEAGHSLSQASFISAASPVGGTLGALMIGRWMDRFRPHRVLTFAYLGAALCIAVIGLSTHSVPLLVLAVFGAGFGISGSQIGANALAAAFYPTASRATGVSWALAVGRTGSVLGSMVGGALLAARLNTETIFFMLAVPAVLAALALLVMGRLPSSAARTPAPDLQANPERTLS
jgi:AAHS family 4-hydroxybenzoate transporter-like MFS transporter